MDTPDRSLRPDLPVTLVYGAFFALGWMFDRQADAIATFSRLSADRWIGAALGLGGVLLLAPFQFDPGDPRYAAARAGFVGCYALMMWSLVALTLGAFRRLCRRPRAWVRYLADSSYWMYLLHLPVVVALQIAVAEWPLHWSLKLALVSAATIALSLVTYDLFVRPTFLGRILNGRRRERVLLPWLFRSPRVPSPAAAPAPKAA